MSRVWNKNTERYPPGVVNIMRPGPYGNPFVVGRDGDRDEVCDRFEREILPTLDVEPLRGRDLLCCCHPKRCHGHSIIDKLDWSWLV